MHRKKGCLWKTSEPGPEEGGRGQTALPGAAGVLLLQLHGINKETLPERTALPGATGFAPIARSRDKQGNFARADGAAGSDGLSFIATSRDKQENPAMPEGIAGSSTICDRKNYSGWIAPVGQAPSQAPQSMQAEASTTALSAMLIAPTGQVSTQAPQATHSLVTV